VKRVLLTLAVLSALGGSGYAYYRYRQRPVPPTVTTAPVTWGDLVDRVGATGTLQAVTTVQVGTQVSGTIQSLYADFNSLVRKGQVLARLDPSLFETQVEQARANLTRAQADVERLRVALDDARTKLARARELSGRQLLSRSELDAAEVAARSNEAQLRSTEAQVTQAQAALNQAQVNLAHTVIASPIDGLVISRNVDVGQTVAASMQAPTLYVLAADLTKMQVLANLDESDVGRIRPGQTVVFRVDAYPSEEFTGKVAQVRLQPIVQQNVVTYATVIDVPNPDLKLKPGMTANVNVEIARRANVLRVPNTALRFRPSNEVLAALGQTPPAAGGHGSGDTGRAYGVTEDQTAISSTLPVSAPVQPPVGPSRRGDTPAKSGSTPVMPERDTAAGGYDSARRDTTVAPPARDSGERRGRLLARLQTLPPEERDRAVERMLARGFDPTARGGRDNAVDAAPSDRNDTRDRGRGGTNERGGADSSGRGVSPLKSPLATRNPEATTIDALFGPLPTVETVGRVWLFNDGRLSQVRVRLGITDGQTTELLEGPDIEEGTALVTNVTLGNATTRPALSAFPPFIGGQPVRFGGPGGGVGRGGGGGR